MKIRVAVGQFHDLTDERLRFAAQIGATGLQMNNPTLPGDKRWEEKDVRALVEKTEAAGLKFEAIENVPTHFYDKVMLGAGRPRRADRELPARRSAPWRAPACRCSGYHFMPNSVWTTERDAPTRGGADGPPLRHGGGRGGGRRRGQAAVLHADDAGAPVVDAGLRQGRHHHHRRTDVGELRILHQGRAAGGRGGGRHASRSIRTIRRCRCWAASRACSTGPGASSTPMSWPAAASSWALDLCLGCCSEMPGGKANVTEMIEYLRAQGRDRLHPFPRRAGHGAELHRVLHRRRQLRPGRSHGAARAGTALTASCSTTTCPRWTATATGTIAAAPTPSATCRGCCAWPSS